MLTELRVRDLAVIADVTLPLMPGLNVLTGETGAGKSMLVDALALLLGERASTDSIRPGAQRAVVEAAFEVGDNPAFASAAREAGIELEDGRLVVRREIRAEGPNRAWANGSPTTVGALAALGALLVDLHGQHEAQSLLRTGAQRDILDAFAGAEEPRGRVAGAHAEAARLRAEEAGRIATRDDVLRRADYLRHVAREIAAADPRADEEADLDAEARRLSHAEELIRLAESLSEALDADETGALDRIRTGERLLGQLAKIDPSTERWRELLDGAFAAVDELARAVRDYATDTDLDPERLAEVERRRDLLFRLKQKYGPTLDDVRRTGDDAARALEGLDTADMDLAALAERRAAAEETLRSAAVALTALRRKAGQRLAKEVERLLPGLGMPQGKFFVELSRADDIGPTGADRVAFLVQLNVGLDARPLAQVASGGELSRLMLALKVVLARHDAVPTLVFDEVDQGIGAEVGAQVADALATVALQRQVLVITHLAQIAARANHHLQVVKRTRGGMTSAGVQVLGDEARETEIARMLGGAGDRALREHAAGLLKARGLGGKRKAQSAT